MNEYTHNFEEEPNSFYFLFMLKELLKSHNEFYEKKSPEKILDINTVLQALKEGPKIGCVAMRLKKDIQIHSASLSYFGGTPTLPSNIEWPYISEGTPIKSTYAMPFIGQIDCSELPIEIRKSKEKLPEQGIIFFFANWHPEYGLLEPSCKVLFSGTSDNLYPHPAPENILAPRKIYSQQKFPIQTHDKDQSIFPKYHISMIYYDKFLLGDFSNNEVVNSFLHCDNLNYLEQAIIADTIGFFDECACWHSLIGIPQRQCSHIKDQVRDSEGRILLAEFDSDDLMDWDWNFYLQLWIHEEDLQKRNFDNVVAQQSK